MAKITALLRISPTDLIGLNEPGTAAAPDTVKGPILIGDDERHQRSLEMLQRFSALSRPSQNQLLREAEVMRVMEEFHGVARTETAFQQQMSALGNARIEIFRAWLAEMPKLEFKG